MAGLLDDWRKSQYLQMAEEKLQGLLNIPTEAQRFITNPQAFMSLLGKNELPRETGFAAGATGLPPKNVEPGGVLNPKAEPYTKGYEQGEPFSYAAMALPMAAPVGKAIAPKAYDMLENYMVRTGGMIPLEAYHGTPHNIQGKFDINKVGTGEGAQSYGHGIYFAENPAVAETYRHAGEVVKYVPTMEKFTNGANYFMDDAGNYMKVRDYVRNDVPVQVPKEEYLQKFNEVKSIQEKQKPGNIYKVDIPDKDIPNMLDWDKSFSKQTKAVQEAVRQIEPKLKQVNPDINVEKLNGEGIYRAYQQYRGNQPDFASEGLNEIGIKGIRYLDQASRTPGFTSLTPSQLETRMDILKQDIKSGLGNQEVMKDQLRKMQVEADSYKNMTSNFVVFDPSTVKILEKNKKKVGLLD